MKHKPNPSPPPQNLDSPPLAGAGRGKGSARKSGHAVQEEGAVSPSPLAGEDWGEGPASERLVVSEGPVTPYLANYSHPVLGRFTASKTRGIVPANTPEQTFELYSVPAFEARQPEIVTGAQIGSNKQIVEPGTVILCKINPRINRAWVVGSFSEHPKIASTEWITFPPHEDIEPKYLAHFLSQDLIRRYLASQASGVGGSLMRVKPSVIRDFPLPLPPLDDQRRIVAELETQLTRLDASVTALKRVQANLKRYRASVLKDACEGRLVSTEADLAYREGRAYETGTEILVRVLTNNAVKSRRRDNAEVPDSSSLPPLPQGWTWVTLPQLGELNRGKSKHRPRDDERLYGGPYPFIQTGDVRKSAGTVRDHSQTYSEFGLAQSRLWPAGTLCITIAANIAETGVLTFPACFPDSVVGFIHEGARETTRWIDLFLRTAKEKLERFAPATAQKNINLDVLSKVAVPLPPLAEQLRIVAEVERRLSVIEELEGTVAANLKRAERLRQATLQQAFARGADA